MSKNKKILIIDDDPHSSKLLEAFLTNAGYTVEMEHDGLTGLKTILTKMPDLVILDIMMPKMTGYQVMEQVRSLPSKTGKVPIIVISAKSSMGKTFENSDILCFLSKPFDMNQLHEKIKYALGESAQVSAEYQWPEGSESKEKALFVGLEEYVSGKVKEHLESLGYVIQRCYEEKEVAIRAEKMKPGLILIQYWEDPEKFDAVKVYQELQANNETKGIPFLAYCLSGLAIEASKDIPAKQVIGFKESKDLQDKLNTHLQHTA